MRRRTLRADARRRRSRPEPRRATTARCSLIGSDTWINPRWQHCEALMDEARGWLGALPREVAQRIGWGNGAARVGL